MRFFLVSAAALLFTSTAAAQSRWTVSAGPEWSGFRGLWGLRFRADYDLSKQNRPFQLRLQGGTRWGPTQSYHGSYRIIGGSFSGEDQTVDVTFGVVGALSPIPRARFAPYVTGGVLARQAWSRGWSIMRDSSGSATGTTTPQSTTYGQVFATLGVGMRANLGGRVYQLEYRRLGFGSGTQGLMLGTTLPF